MLKLVLCNLKLMQILQTIAISIFVDWHLCGVFELIKIIGMINAIDVDDNIFVKYSDSEFDISGHSLSITNQKVSTRVW